MAARPKREDTEEDLLKFQEQFITNESIPAATVVRATKEVPACGEKRESTLQRDVVDLKGLPQASPFSYTGSEAPPKKKSKFKEKRIARNKAGNNRDDLECDGAELLERHDNHISTILSEIKERDIQRSEVYMPSNILQKGFPEVVHRGTLPENEKPNQTSSQGKLSLFAQHFKISSPTLFGIPASTSKTFSSTERKGIKDNTTNMESKGTGESVVPALICGEGLMIGKENPISAAKEIKNIHKENLDRLASMTKEEILEEQAKLKSSLDPSLIAFLQLRHQKKSSPNANLNLQEQEIMETEVEGVIPEIIDTKETSLGILNPKESEDGFESVEAMDIEKDGSDSSNRTYNPKHVYFDDKVKVISQEGIEDRVVEVEQLSKMASSQKWIHMDKVEPEKLEWMKDCPSPSAIRKEGGNQARFAFDGGLVTKDTKMHDNLGLHHHGDNPESPGYTLEELFILARSSFLQQRVIALQTLARIITQMKKTRTDTS